MARVEVSHAAVDDLDNLIRVLSLSADTRARVRSSLELLGRFPRLGPELGGRWRGLRFVLGPWRWMLVVYEYLEEGRVVVLTIQDARSSSAVTGAS